MGFLHSQIFCQKKKNKIVAHRQHFCCISTLWSESLMQKTCELNLMDGVWVTRVNKGGNRGWYTPGGGGLVFVMTLQFSFNVWQKPWISEWKAKLVILSALLAPRSGQVIFDAFGDKSFHGLSCYRFVIIFFSSSSCQCLVAKFDLIFSSKWHKCPAPGNWTLVGARKRQWEDNKTCPVVQEQQRSSSQKQD